MQQVATRPVVTPRAVALIHRSSFSPPIALLAALLALASGADAGTVWLCHPDAADNPCQPSLDTTLVSPPGEVRRVRRIRRPRHPKVDCFYVYPTVSDQPTGNANLEIDPELR